MSRKVTKKMLLNLYRDRVEFEDELRERDYQDHRASCERANEQRDQRLDQFFEVLKTVGPQLFSYIAQTSSGSASAAGEASAPYVPTDIDLVDRLFESLESTPDSVHAFMSALKPEDVGLLAELHQRVIARRGHIRGGAPAPLPAVRPVPPYVGSPLPMVGGLVKEADFQRVMLSRGADPHTMNKIGSMLQFLTAADLKSLAILSTIANNHHEPEAVSATVSS